MSDTILCPECGKKVRKGSTFCLNCGSRLTSVSTDDFEITDTELTIDEQEKNDSEDVDDVLPPLDESDLITDDTLAPSILGDSEESTHETESEKVEGDSKTELIESPGETLEWDTTPIEETPESKDETPVAEIEQRADDIPAIEPRAELEWDTSDVIREGMPFKEVKPPIVLDDDAIATGEAMEHLFPDSEETDTREAVTHLFPKGRGSTSKDFIDIVVGKPKKIGLEQPMRELEDPLCTNCGMALSSDEFEYPAYVYEAMGRARLEHGEMKLKEDEHEAAIAEFEKAKKLYERAKNEKMIEESIKKIDEGYESMADFHYQQAESHMKEEQYEWAIVQYKKARELFMLTTDTKKRVKCAQKVREAFVEWGKYLEDEGNSLSKMGESREALTKYQEAAKKYREGDEPKKLRGLEKKIMKA